MTAKTRNINGIIGTHDLDEEFNASESSRGKTQEGHTTGSEHESESWQTAIGFQVNHEERTPVVLKVTGDIPGYAAGTLYRTGPGGYQVDAYNGKTVSMSHWFDGFSQVHRFEIIPPSKEQPTTKVTYNSRHTCDAMIERIRQTGSLNGFTFGQKRDPCDSFFKKVISVFSPQIETDPKSGKNIGVTLSVNSPAMAAATGGKGNRRHASNIDNLFTKTDTTSFQRLDPETLEPIGIAQQTELHPELMGPLSAAHAKSDPVTGDFFNYNLNVGATGAIYRIFRTSKSTGQTDILARIDKEQGAYLHSLILTKNYVILAVWSSYYAVGGAKLLWEKNILDAIAPFDPDKNVNWYVIDRKGGKGVVSTFESDPFFCFHTVNGWEEPSEAMDGETDVVADLCVYDNLDVMKSFYYEYLVSSSGGAKKYAPGSQELESTRWRIKRFRLPAVTTREPLTEVTLDFAGPKEASPELPTFNPRFACKPNRYIYGISNGGLSLIWDRLAKFDAETQTAIYWSEKCHTPGEAIFIPRPEGTEEDDGILLSVILDGFAQRSYLLCLDARTMKERGRAEMECVVGIGFHGLHYPKDQPKEVPLVHL